MFQTITISRTKGLLPEQDQDQGLVLVLVQSPVLGHDTIRMVGTL